MKKGLKIAIIVSAALLNGMILCVCNALFGNPLCGLAAKRNINRYLAANYSDTDYRLERVSYNLKTNGYEGAVISPSAVDEYFNVSTNGWGVVKSDGYDYVRTGFNTWRRLCEDYRALTEPVISNLPYESDIAYGDVALCEKSESEFSEPFGMELGKLEINGTYDMTQLGKDAGYLVYYVRSEDVSVEQAAEILLTLREAFDDAGVYFHSIDFTLQATEKGSDNEIHILNFLYEDITADGLADRIRERHREVSEWYDRLDRQSGI